VKLSNLYKPSKYINKIKSINNSIKKSHRIIELINVNFLFIPLSYVWKLEKKIFNKEILFDISEYKIFGTQIDLNNINWHKDYVSGFEYPQKRFDKIKIEKWFDKGIDVKFPWEVSRFYFAIRLAQNYRISNNEKHYTKFKDLVLDWIDKNPYCFGVNWVCTMEVAIRAINLIIAINMFGKVFYEDYEFNEVLLNSLIQHAEYISTFPEIYDSNHTTNHTTADYAGLLFLALTLKEHTDSTKWLNQAIGGLEGCIRYQTYEDGVNFEASIPYHRLVLEMFAYSTVVAKANNIELSKKYYELLFKMFEYTAAYMDHNGNAPQVGDNDSGRILIFHESDEHDHSYLLDLGEHIFDYEFKSQCKKRNPEFKQWLPEINKINIDELNVKPRETDKSIAFKNGGAYFLKNENFSLMVSCFPIGQNGVGGHNHCDMGSFTLSYKGKPIIVDPGTYTYTRDFSQRNMFRSLFYHNVSISDEQNTNKTKILDIFHINEPVNIFKIKQMKNSIYLNINNIIKKQFLMYDDSLDIKTESNSNSDNYLIINPYLELTIDSNTIKLNLPDNHSLNINSKNKILVEDSEYSNSYQNKVSSKKIIIKSKNKAIIEKYYVN